MKYCNCGSIEFLKKIEGKQVICAGASSLLERYIATYKDWFVKLRNEVKYIVDNDVNKQGLKYNFAEYLKQVVPFSALEREKDIIILICTGRKYVTEIMKQLEKKCYLENTECYYLPLLFQYGTDRDALAGVKFETMPIRHYVNERIIHCCWLSGEKKPHKYQECIDSWKRYCPDYRIIEWNADNYDFSGNVYAKEAYEKKEWAFASDYIRLDVVYRFGGIYLDMDVELLRNIDNFLRYRAFFCFDWGNYIDLGSGFGALKGDEFLKKLLDCYNGLHFVNEDMEKDRLPQPSRLISQFKEYGLNTNGITQIIEDRVFLSGKYFSVFNGRNKKEMDWKGSEYALHWHNAGWFSEEQKEQRKNGRMRIEELKNIFGRNKD